MISLKVVLIKEPSDLSTCDDCKEIIYGNMYTLYVVIMDEKESTEKKYCESCRQTIYIEDV